MKKCTKCGFGNRDNSKFCVKCGNAFSQNIQEQEQIQNICMMSNPEGKISCESTSTNLGKPKKRRKGVIIAAIILLVGIICFSGSMFLLGKWGNILEPYEKPIAKLIEAENENNIDKMMEVLPIKYGDTSYEKIFRNSISESTEEDNIKVTRRFEIVEEKHLNKEALGNTEVYKSLYAFSFAEKDIEYKLTDGYEIKTKIIATNQYGGEMEVDTIFKVCKWNGNWYIFGMRYEL